MRELSIPTRKTNPIHNDVLENTIFLLFDQSSGEANRRKEKNVYENNHKIRL